MKLEYVWHKEKKLMRARDIAGNFILGKVAGMCKMTLKDKIYTHTN